MLPLMANLTPLAQAIAVAFISILCLWLMVRLVKVYARWIKRGFYELRGAFYSFNFWLESIGKQSPRIAAIIGAMAVMALMHTGYMMAVVLWHVPSLMFGP